MCLGQPSCLPTTRRSRYSIPAAAAPKPAGCGSMHVTIDPGPGPNPERPAAHLQDFRGVLQVDGFAGFERLPKAALS